MANTVSLNRKLLLAILKPSKPPTPCLLPTPPRQCETSKAWVRSITSKANQHRNSPSVSFGDEADAALASYLNERTVSKDFKLWQSKTGDDKNPERNVGQAKEMTQTPIEPDGYEISSYIDRSTPTKRQRKSVISNMAPDLTSQSIANTPSKEVKRRKTMRSAQTESENFATTEGNPIRAAPLRKKLEPWKAHRAALKDKFPEGWNPRKKLSPDAMDGIRGLHQQDPVKYSTDVLAEQFQTSAEAVRRILKSKWMSKQAPEKIAERRERWAKRHDRIWDQQAELGLRPQRKKDAQVEDPDKFEQDMERKRILGET